ncbi:MAG: cupin domain-containing protein [Chitinophagaceae bacterium]
MKITYPHTIENCMGEKIIFKALQKEPDGDRLVGENYVAPGQGPLFHTHWLQDESLTVIKGKIGYLVQGQPAKYANAGETVLFQRGVPHRFWNAGQEPLHCKAWIKPANSFVFFISSIFAAQNKSGKAQPELFDAAYLLKRYSPEYDLAEISQFVKRIIIPIAYYTGKILGKYEHFKNAPEPVKQ